MSETRCCSQCHTDLPLTDFYSNGAGGRRTTCSICDRFNERVRARRRSRRDPREMPDRVPVEPFRDWLRQRLTEIDVDQETYASRIGVSMRRLSEIVHGRTRTAGIDQVDRALLADGWHLSQLYPEMYPDASPVVIDLLQRVGEAEACVEWETQHEREAA